MSEPVIVLIIAYKDKLDWYEEIGLRQCFRVLGNHPISLVCPDGLNVDAHRRIAPKLRVDFIPPHWQSSYKSFFRLKVLPFLYRRYARYEYILFHELDAFVFRDDLARWCASGWDYIGAPWFEGYNKAAADAKPLGAGNGGFCLRRTAAMLRVSRTLRY